MTERLSYRVNTNRLSLHMIIRGEYGVVSSGVCVCVCVSSHLLPRGRVISRQSGYPTVTYGTLGSSCMIRDRLSIGGVFLWGMWSYVLGRGDRGRVGVRLVMGTGGLGLGLLSSSAMSPSIPLLFFLFSLWCFVCCSSCVGLCWGLVCSVCR